MIGINDMYRADHRITSYGIEGYAVEKKYSEGTGQPKSKNDRESREEQKKR